MKLFWISWYQPTEDYRTIYDKRKESEPFGHRYWCSGETCSEPTTWTMCAMVDASSEEDAMALVLSYWPEAEEWRFCEEKPTGWAPGDRFPMPKERRKAAK